MIHGTTTMAARVAMAAILVSACGGRNVDTAPTVRTGALTPATIDSLWMRADAQLAARKWDDAAVMYERLQLEMDSGDRRVPLARFRLAEARLGQKSNLQAVREFRRVADDFATDSLAPVALVRAGDAYGALWRRPELDPTYGYTALATYQEVVSRFPGTTAAAQAQLKISELEDKFAWKAHRSARFYLRYKAYDSAILMLKDVVATYPRAKVIPEALADLVTAYQKLGYEEDLRETCTFFRRFHADAPEVKVCPADSPAAPAATPPAGGTPGT